MNPETGCLIEAIHHSAGKCVLAMTGGGTGAAASLLGVPGGSRTILEVVVPYHEESLVQFLGNRPAQFCSAPTSRAMARRAYERATWLAPGQRVLGVGCTASLATDRPKRGDHRFHVTCHNDVRITTYSLVLRKGERARESEETVLDSVLLNALAEAYGLPERVPVPLLSEETVQIDVQPAADPLQSLVTGGLRALYVELDGRIAREAPHPAALLPGAFNPAHEGHWRLVNTASRLLGSPVMFELSVTNVDKPALPAAEIRRRLQQFAWRMPVWVTAAPTFAEKACLFPGAVFVLGADTAERILAPRYYEDNETRIAEALEQIRRQGCRFLVAGREERAGKYLGLENLCIPEASRDLFSGIPKADFHVPISSTALRELAANTQNIAQPEDTD
jgi:hypothetical protein